MRLPVLPVRTATDATLDFQKLQQRWNEFDNSVAMGYRNAAQNAAPKINTQIKLDTIIKDPGGNLDLTNGWYLVPSTGYYAVFGETLMKEAKGFCLVSIQVSGVEKLRGNETNQAAQIVRGDVVSGIVDATKGQHIDLWVYQEGLEPLEILGEPGNRLSVVRVA